MRVRAWRRSDLPRQPGFRIGRTNVDFGGREELSNNETARLVGGLDGKLGAWDLKFYYEHGESRRKVQDGHNVILAKDPAVIPSFFITGTLATNAQIYDTLGRTYTAGVRLRF